MSKRIGCIKKDTSFGISTFIKDNTHLYSTYPNKVRPIPINKLISKAILTPVIWFIVRLSTWVLTLGNKRPTAPITATTAQAILNARLITSVVSITITMINSHAIILMICTRNWSASLSATCSKNDLRRCWLARSQREATIATGPKTCEKMITDVSVIYPLK